MYNIKLLRKVHPVQGVSPMLYSLYLQFQVQLHICVTVSFHVIGTHAELKNGVRICRNV